MKGTKFSSADCSPCLFISPLPWILRHLTRYELQQNPCPLCFFLLFSLLLSSPPTSIVLTTISWFVSLLYRVFRVQPRYKSPFTLVLCRFVVMAFSSELARCLLFVRYLLPPFSADRSSRMIVARGMLHFNSPRTLANSLSQFWMSFKHCPMATLAVWQRPYPNPRHSILPDSEPSGFDPTFAHGLTLHFPCYVGQSGSSPCPSTPTNAIYKNCKHSIIVILYLIIFMNKSLQNYKSTVKLSYCSATAFFYH